MKALVEKIIEEYPRYLREEALFERHLEMRENEDMRDALVMLKIRVSVVESWFVLLDADERFAFRQAIQTEQNGTAARRAAAMMWMWRLIKVGETPWVIRERAVEKIASFVSAHADIMQTIFDDV